MKTSLKRLSALMGLTMALALAGGSAFADDGYRFETVGQPHGITLTIRVVDAATGLPATLSHLYAVRRQWMPTKGVPQFIDRRIPLTADANGNYTYHNNDVQSGVTVRLLAQTGADDHEIWGTVRVPE